MSPIDLLWIVPVVVTLVLLAAVMVVTLPASVVLLGVLAGQVLGVVRGVPFQYNLRNLLVRWQTNFMMAAAFTLVVALLTVMLAFVNGMYKLTQNSGDPRNVFVLADGATDELFSNLGFGDVKELGLQPGVLKDDDGQPLASWELYCIVNQPILTRHCSVCGQMAPIDRFGRALARHGSPECPGSGASIVGSRGRRLVQVRGIEDPAKSGKIHGLPLKAGSWFGQSGVQPLPGSSTSEQAMQAVIGEGLAREFGPDHGKAALEVGDVFDLGPRKWIVAGIMASAGSTFDSEVWGKFQLVGQQFGKPSFTTCVLRTAGPEEAKELAAFLKKEYKKPAVASVVETEYFATLNATNQQFLIATVVVMLIMAIGSAFGVMNTMFAAISQRTKDIGVLRILGYSRWQVLTSFFMEALVLALLSGALGCALGSLVHGMSATSNIAAGPGGGKSVVIRLVVDYWTLSIGMGFALFMGCVGGLLPALSAVRLRALESLR